MRRLLLVPLVCLVGCCAFNAQATSTAIKDWNLLKPYTEQGIQAAAMPQEEKEIRLALMRDFGVLLERMNSNAE